MFPHAGAKSRGFRLIPYSLLFSCSAPIDEDLYAIASLHLPPSSPLLPLPLTPAILLPSTHRQRPPMSPARRVARSYAIIRTTMPGTGSVGPYLAYLARPKRQLKPALLNLRGNSNTGSMTRTAPHCTSTNMRRHAIDAIDAAPPHNLPLISATYPRPPLYPAASPKEKFYLSTKKKTTETVHRKTVLRYHLLCENHA